VIVVGGADAEAFLAAQLGRKPPAANEPTAPLAAWHDAKGRVQGLFRVVRSDQGFWLMTEADAAAGIAGVASGSLRCAALVGDCAARLGALGLKPGDMTWHGDFALLRLAPNLAYSVGLPAAIDSWAESLPRGSESDAELAEIRLGLPALGAALRGAFLPQMLNLDALGAVVFDKGCYPGQEIIARTHHLGAVKRRLYRFVAGAGLPAAPAPGTALVDAQRDTVGTVVRAARADNAVELLAVVATAATATALFIDGSETPLRLEPLP